MKVSVVIPIYNGEKYLKECLDSIANQTLNDIEIICINDGSIDNTRKILEEYAIKYNNIKVINQKNLGVSKSRNIAVDIAKGKYIYFVDSDDYIKLELLEKCYNEAEKYNLDITMLDLISIYENNVNKKTYVDRYYAMGSNVFSGEYVFNLMIEENIYGWWTCCIHFFKSEFLKSINIKLNEEIRHEDIIYITEAMIKAKYVKHIGERGYFYRIRSGSRSSVEMESHGINGHFTAANLLQSMFYNYRFENEVTLKNLNQYINYFYKRAIMDCDNALNYKKRVELYKNSEFVNRDISIEIQVDTPNLYYARIPNKLSGNTKI